jgi:hypothetical protein
VAPSFPFQSTPPEYFPSYRSTSRCPSSTTLFPFSPQRYLILCISPSLNYSSFHFTILLIFPGIKTRWFKSCDVIFRHPQMRSQSLQGIPQKTLLCKFNFLFTVPASYEVVQLSLKHTRYFTFITPGSNNEWWLWWWLSPRILRLDNEDTKHLWNVGAVYIRTDGVISRKTNRMYTGRFENLKPYQQRMLVDQPMGCLAQRSVWNSEAVQMSPYSCNSRCRKYERLSCRYRFYCNAGMWSNFLIGIQWKLANRKLHLRKIDIF